MNDYKELIELLAHPADGRDSADIMICAADAIEQLMRERDAAVEDLKQDANCDFCKWFIGGDCTDFEHEECHGEHWEWRGVQNEID